MHSEIADLNWFHILSDPFHLPESLYPRPNLHGTAGQNWPFLDATSTRCAWDAHPMVFICSIVLTVLKFFPKQVYLYGVLTPFKGLHPWAAWFCLCLRACVPLWVLWPHAFTLVSHLSPACLPLWVLWAACCCICFPLVSHLSPTLGPTLGALGRMLLHLSATCLPHLSPTLGGLGRMILHLSPTLVSHSGCSGSHDFTLVSHLFFALGGLGRVILDLSPTCLPLWVLWAAWFYICLPHLSSILGALGRRILHLSPTCLPLVSHLSPSPGALGRVISHLSPTLGCHSECSGPHDSTLVSHSGWSGLHAFIFVSHLFSRLTQYCY